MRRVTVVITCDHPGCQATYTAPLPSHAATLATVAGWLTGAGVDACPQHWNRTHPAAPLEVIPLEPKAVGMRGRTRKDPA